MINMRVIIAIGEQVRSVGVPSGLTAGICNPLRPSQRVTPREGDQDA